MNLKSHLQNIKGKKQKGFSATELQNNQLLVLFIFIILTFGSIYFKYSSYKLLDPSIKFHQWEWTANTSYQFPPKKNLYGKSSSFTPLVLYYDVVKGKKIVIEQLIPHFNIINLNTASSEQLQLIKGLGEKTANRIINYRDKHHGFSNISELRHVEGIGAKTYLRIYPFLSINNKKEIK